MPTLLLLALLSPASDEASPAPTTPLPSGREVWRTRATVESGGQRTFHTRNVRAGSLYTLHATARCRAPRPAGQRPVQRLDGETGPVFGLDWRVTIGSLGPMWLKVGRAPVRTTLTFRAREDDPQLLVADHSSPRPGLRCTLRDVSVRVP